MRASDLSTIRGLPLFSEMSDDNFTALMKSAFFQRFPAHVGIIAEGDLPDFLHVVVDGLVELYAHHNARETTLDLIGPTTTFILAAVIRDEPYLKSARTVAPSQILMIPAEAVRDIFGQDASFARAIVSELADRYRCVVRALKNEKLRTSTERLANWILRAGTTNGGCSNVALSFDKRTLASQLGMTPENLSRGFSLLSNHGVKTTGRDIVIEDQAALNRFANPNPLLDG